MIIVKLTKKEIRALRSFIEYFVENIPIKKQPLVFVVVEYLREN